MKCGVSCNLCKNSDTLRTTLWGNMDLNYLKKLLKIFDESTLSELAIEEEGVNVKLARNISSGTVQTLVHAPYTQQMQQAAPVAPAAEPAPVEKAPAGKATHKVLSPIVGTFYRAPAPDADSFVKVGDKVTAGQTVCIVEAMKLMNEIESDMTGTIVKILVENQNPVEYNQPLFEIDPS